MRTAVVILNWNGRFFLEKFLPSVLEHSSNATIYVADNASTDDSVEYISSTFPSINIIEISENLGFAGGYNFALKDLAEEFFVLLNSDVEVTENWLKPIEDLFDADENVAAIQPKILSFHNKSMFEYAGASGGYIDKLGYPFCRGRMFDTLEEDKGQYEDVADIFWATGACMAVRNSVYHEHTGLDADFFAHMEEIDLCWRIKRSGYRIMVQPQSVVYHVGGGTLSKSNPHKTFLNFRNGLELLTKNLPSNKLVATILIRMILDGVAAFKFLTSGQPRDFWAVIRAHLAYYGRLNSTLKKRDGNYSLSNELYRNSVVVEYFLNGKKRFTDLDSGKF